MATLNRLTLIGRLTADPEPAKTTQTGSSVVKFRFAVGRSRKNPQTGQWENDPNPLYIDCEAWTSADGKGKGKLVSEYLRKGSEIYLEGRLQLDTWQDKEGQTRSKHKVVVEDIQFLGGKSDGQQQPPQQATAPGWVPGDPASGDIPF